jgi:iron complex outermembrane receptor protein
VVIEAISSKGTRCLEKTILNLASNGRGGSVSSSLHKGNNKDGNALGTFKYSGDKEARLCVV